ncbi:MAG: hypothetical protein ACOC38_02025 [Promethearchaeia archaeon]
MFKTNEYVTTHWRRIQAITSSRTSVGALSSLNMVDPDEVIMEELPSRNFVDPEGVMTVESSYLAKVLPDESRMLPRVLPVSSRMQSERNSHRIRHEESRTSSSSMYAKPSWRDNGKILNGEGHSGVEWGWRLSDSEKERKRDSDLISNDSDTTFFGNIMHQLEITGGTQIARRYLAMNAFDGILPVVGIIMGGFISLANQNSQLVFKTILLGSIGTAIAMFVSGITSSYLTEQAERKRDVKELEKSMLSDMGHTVYAKASRTTTIVVSIINGISPTLAALGTITPMFIALTGLLDYVVSMYASIIAGLILLYALGMFLGRISKVNLWIAGLKTLAAGFLTVILMMIISILTST